MELRFPLSNLRLCTPHPEDKSAVEAQLGLRVALGRSGVNVLGAEAFDLSSGVNGLGLEAVDLSSGANGLGERDLAEAFDLSSCGLSGVSGLGGEAFDLGSCVCLGRFFVLTRP